MLAGLLFHRNMQHFYTKWSKTGENARMSILTRQMSILSLALKQVKAFLPSFDYSFHCLINAKKQLLHEHAGKLMNIEYGLSADDI